MEENVFDNEDVKKYLNVHQIPEAIESLLTAVGHYKPSDPLTFILKHLHTINEGNLPSTLTWDIFIKPADLPVPKVFKPSFVEQHIFDNPFLREKNHKQMITAIEHHSKVQRRKYFGVLKLYQQHRLRKKHIDKQNSQLADAHFQGKLKRRVVTSWVARTKIYMKNVAVAIKILLKSLSYTYISRCFVRWRLFTKDIHWKNNYFQKQALKQTAATTNSNQPAEPADDEDIDYISRLPTSVAVKIFKYVNLKSRVTCSMVCHSWHALLQDCSLYTELDLTNSGFIMHDVLFNNIIRRYKFFLYHVKLSKCNNLSIKSLANLKECKNLQDIDLSKCMINAQLIQEIGIGCPFLTYLNLAESTIDDTCLANLSKHFPSLKYLDLTNCKALTQSGFYYFSNIKTLKNLAHLNLSGCKKVNGNCLSHIGQCCGRLTSIILDYIPTLTDECISMMTATCRHLRVLSLLQATRITDKALKYIAISLTQLEKIYIEGNKFITDSGVASLMGLRNLKHVHIVDCLRVYDTGLKPCTGLRLLSVINFTDCVRLTDGGIKHILESPSFQYIRELSLTNCIRVGDATVQRIVNKCLSLSYLSIAYCENITDVGITMLSHHPKLSMLDISGCSITDYGAGSLRTTAHLSYLTMAECNLLTDIGLERLSKLDNLKYLDISYCFNISDYGMKMLIYEKKCLQTLNIAGCKLVTNNTLSSVASVCDYLLYLNVSELGNITDKGIRFIRMGCKKLNYLNVSYCPKLNYGCITKMLQHGCNVIHTMNVN